VTNDEWDADREADALSLERVACDLRTQRDLRGALELEAIARVHRNAKRGPALALCQHMMDPSCWASATEPADSAELNPAPIEGSSLLRTFLQYG
jgi:hypothetical protein